jgi:tRNA-specific 2-thiouridylase
MSKTRVVVAMSGGVDSSVAAALMVKEGYDVSGIMLKLWSADCDPAENACCTPEAINQAKEVAGMLSIPFYVLDAKKEFKTQIVDQFINRSFEGLTPNPCYFCNKTIRWGYLLDKVLSMGADYLVTGHYAIIDKDENKKYHLRRGLDETKDQSYVLSGLNQEQLSHTLLPLGLFTKDQVRHIARDFNLSVASKPDSQDLCFVGSDDYREFLSKYSENVRKPGNIVDKTGRIVGTHTGIQNFTIGQRKGLGSGNMEPLYVISKNHQNNEIVVGSKSDLHFNIMEINSVNWISGQIPNDNQEYQIKIRYKSVMHPAKVLKADADRYKIKLIQPVRDATPGQIAVIYQGNEVIGSGEIVSAGMEGV